VTLLTGINFHTKYDVILHNVTGDALRLFFANVFSALFLPFLPFVMFKASAQRLK
jgi:hypothetical protein